MTFEEGLVKEFIDRNIRTYPLGAPEGSAPPFIVYRKTNIEFVKTLDGYQNKANGNYSLVLVSKNYLDLQSKNEEIKDILLNLYGKEIGGEGPFIEDLKVSFTGDTYVYETDEYTSNINLEIHY